MGNYRDRNRCYNSYDHLEPSPLATGKETIERKLLSDWQLINFRRIIEYRKECFDMPQKRLPDFLIIGAPKSGTTSLYYYLMQHPNIFMPANKEPMFFTFEGENLDSYHFEGPPDRPDVVTNIEDYLKLFEKAKQNQKIGEASTLYLYDSKTPERIKCHIPDGKMIAIFRNPVDRAFSQYQHYRTINREPLSSFDQAIIAEEYRMQENWYKSYFYLDAGFYSKQVQNYLKYFPIDNFKFFLYEDFKETTAMVKDIFAFIGVDTEFHLDTSARYNVSGRLRFPKIYNIIRSAKGFKQTLRKIISPKTWGTLKSIFDKAIMTGYEPMELIIKEQLTQVYRNDILQLQDIIQRDLSTWLS